MNLKDLLQDLLDNAQWAALPEKAISGLSLSSQLIQPGDLFLAIKGDTTDGRLYINEAVQKGASAILCEAQGFSNYSYRIANTQTPILITQDLDKKLSLIAKRFYGDPSKDLTVIGVTGTNGKTTTCSLLAQSLTQLGIPCGMIGTLGYGFFGELTTSSLTTPDAISLQKYLKELKDKGAKAVAMEVSSHALAQNRTVGIDFESAIFTNLTQDHLDYHGNMEAYGKAKVKLFQTPNLIRVIINADSSFASILLSEIRPDVTCALYTLNNELKTGEYLTIVTQQYSQNRKGLSASLATPWGPIELRSSLFGEFNLRNMLGVLAELCLQGCTLEEAANALSKALPPSGRMQHMGGKHSADILIDYAHTPDALENVLKAARVHCRRHLWCIFGCGGNRDEDKRAKMGNIAASLADCIVLTNDNPRNEEPEKIIGQILEGVPQEFRHKVNVEENRAKAIEYAFSRSSSADLIVIAGKGHEQYQIIKDQKIPFSDQECVTALLGKDPHHASIHHR